MKKFLPFLVLISLVLVIALATYRLNQKQEVNLDKSEEVPTIHFVAAKLRLPEFSLSDLFNEDLDFSLKDLKGKYSLVNFFASWCTTCHAEHQVLLRLQAEKVIDIYGVAWRDIDENTKSYLAQNGNPYQKVAKDGTGLFTKIAGISAVPESFIVDPEGKVVMRYKGNLQEFSIDEIRDWLGKKSNGQLPSSSS